MTTNNRVHTYEIWVKDNHGRTSGGNKFKSHKNAKAAIKKLFKIMDGTHSSGLRYETWKIIDLLTGETVEQGERI